MKQDIIDCAHDDYGKSLKLIYDNDFGGEGYIYLIEGRKDICAKIYKNINKERCEKISIMIKNPPIDPTWLPMKHRSIAWPISLLYNDKNEFIGFTMPYMDKDVFKKANIYYSTQDRSIYLGGKFTYRYLAKTATNIASAVSAIHAKGHRIGDLADKNILVSSNTLVTLIDCDSFEIQDNGKIFYSRVGTPDYLSPELMNKNFGIENISRYYSDLFALGIIIFKFLMLGTHPFQGIGSILDDSPTDAEKIVKGYFPYMGASRSLVTPPDHAPPFEIIPLSLQSLFYKCFVLGYKKPTERPSAIEWVNVLKNELV